MSSQIGPMQEALREECKKRQLALPMYQVVSDRRGGRTAWSAVVTIPGLTNSPVSAKYWYDGQYVMNAYEDASQQLLLLLQKGEDKGPAAPTRQEAVLRPNVNP